MTLAFSENYPATAPRCTFTPVIPHPNVFSSGAVCLSIIGHDWKPAITIKQILLGIQALLNEPNLKSPANQEMYYIFKENRKKYDENVKLFALKFKNP